MYVPPQLIVDFNSRKERAWKEVYDGFFGPLYQYAFRITQSNQEAEDIVHNCFVRIWENEKQYDDAKHLKGTLYTSVKNRCLDNIRQRKSIQSSISEMQYLGETEENREDVFDADVRMSVLLKSLLHEVHRLPRRSREMVLSRYMHRKSSKEIADEMGVTVQTVDNTLSQTRKKLQEKLKDINLGDLILIPVIVKIVTDLIF